MNLISGILKDKSPIEAKRLAYLIDIIKQLGWDSFLDKRTIRPNLRRGELYIRKHATKLTELFDYSFHNINKNNLIDTLNPLLIEMGHVQITG